LLRLCLPTVRATLRLVTPLCRSLTPVTTPHSPMVAVTTLHSPLALVTILHNPLALVATRRSPVALATTPHGRLAPVTNPQRLATTPRRPLTSRRTATIDDNKCRSSGLAPGPAYAQRRVSLHAGHVRIADALSTKGVPTARAGAVRSAVQVQRVLARSVSITDRGHQPAKLVAVTPPKNSKARTCEPIQSTRRCVKVASTYVKLEVPSTATNN
jgi:hypothetical protein